MPVLDLAVHLVLVVVVVGERRMDLAQRQIGMMPLDLLGIPAVSDPVERDHADFDSRSCDGRFSLGIRFDVCVGHGSHDELPAAGNEETEPLLLDGIGSPTSWP